MVLILSELLVEMRRLSKPKTESISHEHRLHQFKKTEVLMSAQSTYSTVQYSTVQYSTVQYSRAIVTQSQGIAQYSYEVCEHKSSSTTCVVFPSIGYPRKGG